MDPTRKAIIDGLARHVVTSAGGGGMGASLTAPVIDVNAGPIVLGLPLGFWVSLIVFIAGAVSSVMAKLPDAPCQASPP